MKHTSINPPQPAVQLLIIACSAFGSPPGRCAWLHGFCLLTLRPGRLPTLACARMGELPGRNVSKQKPCNQAQRPGGEPKVEQAMISNWIGGCGGVMGVCFMMFFLLDGRATSRRGREAVTVRRAGDVGWG